MANDITDEGEGTLKKLRLPIFIVMLLLLGLVAVMVGTELFSFGAPNGLKATGEVQAVPIVDTIDNTILKAPIVRQGGQRLLSEQTKPNEGPQAVWRDTATLWGILMIMSSLVFLVVKRFVETPNDETTVMHLKGDTDTALRAKGGRG